MEQTPQAQAVSIKNLSKGYGALKSTNRVEALKEISLEINSGEMFGIIGPDGAGKTTLFRILTSLLIPDLGQATVLGLDVVKDFKKIRERIGYMPGKFSLYGDLTVDENLSFFASIFKANIKENYYLIEDIFKDIAPFGKRKARDLSGGMKQKLALSCALVHKPDILFLDEPTTGVDPVSRREFWQMLERLKKQGITIVVSTSYMDEALLCDRIALFKEGSILNYDTPKGMISSFENTLLAVSGENMPELLKMLRKISIVKSAYSFGAQHHITVEREENKGESDKVENRENVGNGNNIEKTNRETKLQDVIASVTAQLKQMGAASFNISEIEPTIEDCYLELSAYK